MPTRRQKYYRMHQRFSPVPTDIHHKVSPRALQVFLEIHSIPSNATFTQKSIAARLNLTLTTVKRYIRELVANDYLWIEKKGGSDYVYHLKLDDGENPLERQARLGNPRAQRKLQKKLEKNLTPAYSSAN